MIDPESHDKLKKEINQRIADDRGLLDTLRKEISPLKSAVKRIQPRSTTSISLVGTDGGNNKVEYDPFLVQLVRVVDSSNNEYCLEAITPSSNITELSQKHLNDDESPIGKMMKFLGVERLDKLSHMIRETPEGSPKSSSWVQVYRELTEWAILLSLIREKQFGSDTLIVFDGLLRSKVFAKGIFRKYLFGLKEAIESHQQKNRRKIYLVGFAKHSKVLSRYRLAMALENVMTTDFPAYLQIPKDIEATAYAWSEYATKDIYTEDSGEVFVGGKMFFVKFGKNALDPIWPVDIFFSQEPEASAIMGYLLADAENGFPVPFYPLCLQKAHENAALVDFDFDILQNQILDGIRNILGDEAEKLDKTRLQDADPSRLRY